ncbi:MAG: PVC-type heme-binding CxxCH protein [Planctomycetota bacterium]
MKTTRASHSLSAAKLLLVFCAALAFGAFSADAAAGKIVKALFLGDAKSHHTPVKLFNALEEPMKKVGIDITFTEKNSDLNTENLAKYDCVIMYSNSVHAEESEVKALLDYVESGKGFVPIHCASACFGNSPQFIALVGGKFKRHQTGVFDTEIVAKDHPIMKGFAPFQTWDETYVHDKHNDVGRTILQVRKEGAGNEPWTWVRSQGKGRVFYTAYGHDGRIWSNPGFMELIERGVKWAAGDDNVSEHVKAYPRLARVEVAAQPAAETPKTPASVNDLPKPQPKRTDVAPFEFETADVPFYSPTGKRTGADPGWGKMQKPLQPAESQKHLVLPEGFEAQLFVSDPQIVKPICMAWDHKGRLWVSETIDYPNNKQAMGEGHDRITICEDTNGDGVADKFTVFADKLSIPTSITFANGGVIVQQAPETLFLKSTKDDDHADERKVLFTGWGVGDTHAGPSNLHFGPDNWIWGIVGYSSFNGDVSGEKLKFGAGFYRFKPDGSKLEFIRSNNNNSWGLGFSEEGIVFGSTANGNSNVYMPIPNRYYESVRGWSSSVLRTIADDLSMHPVTEKVRQVDWHGKYTAAAGGALYTARTYPKEFWNRTQFVNEPTGHVTSTFILERNGADFIARNTPNNLVASDDEWTAPISAEVGPDGNVWVIDWYNYIIQHNPTPHGFKNGRGNAYDTPLRDKSHGRIYRIVYKGGKTNPQPKLDPKDPATLLAALKNDNMFWRTTAQRLLVERGNTDVVPELIKLTQDQTIDGAGLTPCAIHALWTMQGLGALDGKNADATAAAIAALKHPSASVRRNALHVIPRTEAALNAVLAAGSIKDQDAQVRLAAFLALAEMPQSAVAATALLDALNDTVNTGDSWIPDAITSAAAAHDVPFLKGMMEKKFAASPEKKTLDLVARIAEHYSRAKPETVATLISSLGGANAKIQESVLAGMAKGWPKDGKIKVDEAFEKSLAQLMTQASSGSKGFLSTLSSRWGSVEMEKHSAEIAKSLLEKLQTGKDSDAERIATAEQLIGLRKTDAQSVRDLFALITPRSSPEFNVGILEAIRQSDAVEGGEILAGGLKSLPPSALGTTISILMEKTNWTPALITALESGKAQMSDLSLDQKQALVAHPNKDLASRAKKLLASGGGMPDVDRQKVIDEYAPKALLKGDVAKGKELFKTNCLKCHTHNGEGGKIGPDLSGMATKPKAELIVDILDPSRSVEGNFRLYKVSTTEGQVFNGLLSSESKTTVELLDAEGKTHPIQREDIKKMETSNKSLMPEGFEKQIPAEGFADLLEFLTQKGKYLPLDLRKVASVVTTKGMFTNRENDAERLIFPDWKPKTFEGVPFNLVDPQGSKVPNAVMLNSDHSALVKAMPKSVVLPCNTAVKAIHFLSGVGGWSAKTERKDGSVSMIVRLDYDDGKTEDIPLKDGVHFADYIGHFDVPESKQAFKLRGQQIRYFSVKPQRPDAKIKQIQLVKGPDHTAPVVMAVTVEPGE